MAPSDVGKRPLFPVDNDTAYEVLSRVDGVTLATAACLNSDFYSISADEKLWEKACNLQWPSTRDPDVKSIVSSLGGFRTFYGECYPLIVNKQPSLFNVGDPMLKDTDVSSDDEEDIIDELSAVSMNDFVSIVDVVFKGSPLYSKVLEGFPDVDDFHGWFSNCPFRIDLLNFADDEDDQVGHNLVTIDGGLPPVTSIAKERKDGKVWNALWENIRLSWILVNKKTKQMVNLASWKPLSGQRHWPSDINFVLRFGSVLPAHRLLPCKVVECNIAMKCKLSSTSLVEQATTVLTITELSLQLQDMAGTHLNGRQSLLVLKEAMNCSKSKNHIEALKSYHLFYKFQSEMKEEKLRVEGRLDTACIIFGIATFISLCYIFL